jgi:ribosome maturation factor RimP
VVEVQQTEDAFFTEARELVESLGYQLIELTLGKHKGSVQARAIIYAPSGTGVDECTKVHRLLYPRIQVLYNDSDPEIEVSSPGMERLLKYPREFSIFQGKGIRIYSRAENAWSAGILSGFDGKTVSLSVKGSVKNYELADIVKARLDYSQEVSHL